MGDEADAIVNRTMSLPRDMQRVNQLADDSRVRELIFNAAEGAGKRGFDKGRDTTRGRLLMQFVEWVGGDFFNWESPIWIAHVAVENFKCGCVIDVTYDRGLEPDYCEKWTKATEQDKLTLFQNVYGYSYRVWRMKVEAERKREREQLQAKWDAQLRAQRTDFENSLREQGIDPGLLP